MALDERKTKSLFSSDLAKERLSQYVKQGDCYPHDIVLHLNTTCNHRCDFCYSRAATDRLEPLSLGGNFALGLITEVSTLGIGTLILSGGGEPLLHPDVLRILDHILARNVRTICYTNLDCNIDHLLDSLSRLYGVNVNINTLDSALYAVTRGSCANLERVKGNLAALVAHRTRLAATVVVRDNTADGLVDTIRQLLSLGVTTVNVSPAFALSYSDAIAAGNKTMHALLLAKERFSSIPSLRVLKPEDEAVATDDGSVFCRTHYFDITVGADTSIYPCCATCYLNKYRIVRLDRYPSFADAWKSGERQKWIAAAKLRCSRCWFAPANRELKALCPV